MSPLQNAWHAGLLALLLGLPCQSQAVSDPIGRCPDFSWPKRAKVQSVAERIEFNDIPMAIRRLETEDDGKTLVAFYREKWAANEKTPAPIEYALGPWQVIASQRGDCFYTVQYKPLPGKGTEALLGISGVPGRALVKESVPMLTGSTLLNDIAHDDAGKTARTVMLKNGFSTATNADFYRRNLEGTGWTVVSHHRMSQPDRNGDVLIMRNGVREVSVTTTRDKQNANQSNVVLNYVDQP